MYHIGINFREDLLILILILMKALRNTSNVVLGYPGKHMKNVPEHKFFIINQQRSCATDCSIQPYDEQYNHVLMVHQQLS